MTSANSNIAQPKVKVYGESAALCAEGTFLPQDGVATINVEMAPRMGAHVDWNRKIVIQLSEKELPLLCCVLLGYLPKVEIGRPGKGLLVERQTNKVLFRGSAGKGNLFLVPLTIGDTFRVSALLLNRLAAQVGLANENFILASLRGAASLHPR